MSMNRVTINNLHQLLEWEVSDADMYGLIEWLNNHGEIVVVDEQRNKAEEINNILDEKNENMFLYK